jgi:hypothetical protein
MDDTRGRRVSWNAAAVRPLPQLARRRVAQLDWMREKSTASNRRGPEAAQHAADTIANRNRKVGTRHAAQAFVRVTEEGNPLWTSSDGYCDSRVRVKGP